MIDHPPPPAADTTFPKWADRNPPWTGKKTCQCNKTRGPAWFPRISPGIGTVSGHRPNAPNRINANPGGNRPAINIEQIIHQRPERRLFPPAMCVICRCVMCCNNFSGGFDNRFCNGDTKMRSNETRMRSHIPVLWYHEQFVGGPVCENDLNHGSPYLDVAPETPNCGDRCASAKSFNVNITIQKNNGNCFYDSPLDNQNSE